MLWLLGSAVAGLALLALLNAVHDRLSGVSTGLKPLRSMPGPLPLPLIGNLLQFVKLGDPIVHLTLYSWQQRFGQLLKFSIPGMGRFVIVSDPSLLTAVWGRPGLPKAALYQEFRSLGGPSIHEGLFTSLEASSGTHYQNVRKAIAPFFATSNLKEQFPLMRAKALKLCARLRANGSDTIVDVEDAMARATLDTFLAAAGFGTEVNALDFQECRMIELQHYATYESLSSYANPLKKQIRRFLPFLPYCREYKSKHDELIRIWDNMAETLMQQPEPDAASNKMTLGDTLRNLLRNPVEGRELGMDWLRVEIEELTGAGMDTSSQTMAFVLLSLALRPEIQGKVAAELAEANLLATPQQPEPRDLAWADSTSLPYLDAVLKEAMRLWPVASTGTARVASEDMELGGYHIPKGTSVQVPFFLLHLLPEYFPDPLKFMPERWLAQEATTGPEPGGKTTKQNTSIESPSFPFKPFSYGLRSCPGQRLAQAEMMTILPILLGRFEVQVAESMGSWDDCWRRQTCAFVLRLTGGMWMRFKYRGASA